MGETRLLLHWSLPLEGRALPQLEVTLMETSEVLVRAAQPHRILEALELPGKGMLAVTLQALVNLAQGAAQGVLQADSPQVSPLPIPFGQALRRTTEGEVVLDKLAGTEIVARQILETAALAAARGVVHPLEETAALVSSSSDTPERRAAPVARSPLLAQTPFTHSPVPAHLC